MGDGNTVWVRFSYERLPNFCYRCGYLRHDDKECGSKEKISHVDGGKVLLYGEWLRATNYGDRFKEGRLWERRDIQSRGRRVSPMQSVGL